MPTIKINNKKYKVENIHPYHIENIRSYSFSVSNPIEMAELYDLYSGRASEPITCEIEGDKMDKAYIVRAGSYTDEFGNMDSYVVKNTKFSKRRP